MMDEKELQPREIKRNRKISPKWKKGFFYTCLGIIAILLCCFLLSLFPSLPLGNIQVQGNSQVSQEEILRSAGLEQTKNIFAVSRSDVRRRLEKDARIELVNEGYYWFNYRIAIKERVISAYISTVDGFVAVDRHGKVLQVQRRFGYMSAPIISGVVLPGLLVGDIFQEESVRIGLNFLVQLAERGAGDLSELDISDSSSVRAYTLNGAPVFLGPLSDLENKDELVAQVLKEATRSGKKIRYLDMKSKVPVVNFE